MSRYLVWEPLNESRPRPDAAGHHEVKADKARYAAVMYAERLYWRDGYAEVVDLLVECLETREVTCFRVRAYEDDEGQPAFDAEAGVLPKDCSRGVGHD